MTPEEAVKRISAVRVRLGRIKGTLFNMIGVIEFINSELAGEEIDWWERDR